MKRYRVYVLKNAEDRSYIGLSEDVDARVQQHNNGVSKWTAKYGPWHLHWQSREMSLGDARKLENRMKRQKGGAGLQTLLEEYQGSSSRDCGITGSNPVPAIPRPRDPARKSRAFAVSS